MSFNTNELIARFTVKGLNTYDTSDLTEEEVNKLTNQVVSEFNKFKLVCDNTSKETQLQSIKDYFGIE